ncbi:MAG: hypothetical protein QM582_04160 [Micropruina sp.]|uniref:hypothetical protein n=1 Tax=Micropruina sp. TaxID=2737536 RepID=UPI0039E47892
MAKRLDKAERARRERAIAARSATVGKPRPKSPRPKAEAPPAKPEVRRPRATGRTRASRSGIGSELAERIAWSMLAALAALVGAGIALALGGAIVPSLCPNDDGTCSFGWMVLIGMTGYALALLPACAIGGLGIWFWVAYLAGYAPLIMVSAAGEWWWWTALVLLPAAAAVASAPLGRQSLPGPQRGGLLGLAVMGLAAVVWWYG